MSEENDGQQAGSNEGAEFTPINSQEELERVLGKRLERERAKFADYEEVKARAAKFDEIEAANKTELEKALETAKAAEERASKAEHAALCADVAAAKGVPASALTGTTREELEACADALLDWRGAQQAPKPKPVHLKSGSAGESATTAKERAVAALRASAN